MIAINALFFSEESIINHTKEFLSLGFMNRIAQRVSLLLVLCVLITFSVSGQGNQEPLTALDSFNILTTSREKFRFFVYKPNRYVENSGYDWRSSVAIAKSKAIAEGDTIGVMKFKLIDAQIYQDLGEYDKSISVAREIYNEKDKLNNDLKRLLLDIMDKNYSELKLYSYQIDIRNEKKELGLDDNVLFYDIYAAQGLYEKARNTYILHMGPKVKDLDASKLAEYNNKIGNYLRLDDSPKVAIDKYRDARNHINLFLDTIRSPRTEEELMNGLLLKGIIEGNIGKCYMELKRYNEAIPLLDSSLVKIKKYAAGKYSGDAIENTLELANCYLNTNKLDSVTSLIGPQFKPIKVKDIIRKNQILAKYYEKEKDFERANYHLNQNTKINDSINVNETLIKQQQIETVFNKDLEAKTELLEEEKVKLERSKMEGRVKDERLGLILTSLIIALLGLIGLVLAYWKSLKNQRVIAKQKYIIENQLTEKDSLLKEIHHRVKNNLQMVSSLLSLQTKNTKSKAAIIALEEGKSRVKAMALIHQKLYQNEDLSVIEMQGYIESLVNSVQSVYKKGGHNINITIDAEGVELDIDRAIPFGLILNELVSNSFKYAFPNSDDNGKIYIHLRRNNTEGFFEYTDNGVGMDEDSEDRVNASMGIRLINRLVNQLQSSLNTDKTAEGVRFWFNFK